MKLSRLAVTLALAACIPAAGAFFVFADELPVPSFALEYAGSTEPIDYSRFGQFKEPGTPEYAYVIRDRKGLEAAAGTGVYPSPNHKKEPRFMEFRKHHRDKFSPWDHVNSVSAEEDLFAWASAQESDTGMRIYFTAEALRRAGFIRQAVKAYYALVIHYPRTYMWSRDKSFYWYAGPEAISRIRKLCATYPALGIELEGALIDIDRHPSGNPERDRIRVWPGRFVKKDWGARPSVPVSTLKERGGKVSSAFKGPDGQWRLLFNGKPFFIRGMHYVSTPVGVSAHDGTMKSWMGLDTNANGLNDGMEESWLDRNGNNLKDADEPVVGDARLLTELGVNTLRYYHGQDAQGRYNPAEYNKDLMRRLARDYGIYFVLGDFLGAYTIGSGASWQLGTDYRNPAERERMKESVRQMVLDHKDEPYVLMWLLGNENQHPGTRTNASQYPKEYAEFVNEVARMIRGLDPTRLIAVSNLGSEGLKAMARFTPEVDVYGTNVYAGEYSMGSIVQLVKAYYDRPILFTEWGCDAWEDGKGENETMQAEYIVSNWTDVELHAADARGEGNVIGGILFEWMDEWWKSLAGGPAGNPGVHDHVRDGTFASPDGWAHEEWFGIISQGDGGQSPFLRKPRKAYEVLKALWTASRAGQ